MSDISNFTELALKVTRNIMQNREKYVQAFVAETGLLPSQCKIVEEQKFYENGVRVTVSYVMKREGEENDVRYQEIRSLIQRMAEVGDELSELSNKSDSACNHWCICCRHSEKFDKDIIHAPSCPVTRWKELKKEMEG